MFRSVAAAAIAAGVISTALVGSAQARITEIKIDTVEPFAEGQPFGEAGSYERVRGIAKGELDPQSPQNQPIVDLDKAPRNARGFVEYETDFFILRPLDPSRGNGTIFYEVNNRGRKALLARIDEAPPNNNDPRTLARRRPRLLARPRLHHRVVRLGPRCPEDQWRHRRALPVRDR